MSRWFRHYAGMMRDEKLVSAAVKSKQPVERVVWVWGAILESAAEINDGGRFEFDAGEAAYFLRCGEDELGSILDCLRALGRIGESIVVRWSERQFDSDGSKERQRRYRERQKAGDDVQKRSSDDRNQSSDVTQPSRDADVTPQETDTEISEPSGSGAGAPIDPRQQLWSEGVSILKTITGKTESAARQLIGRWCRDAGDDCAVLLSKIQTAQRERIGDPVSWITAAIKPSDKPPKPQSIGDMFREDAKRMGLLHEPSDDQTGRLETSFGDRQGVGSGGTLLVAFSSNDRRTG